jgi:hypothetical protein
MTHNIIVSSQHNETMSPFSTNESKSSDIEEYYDKLFKDDLDTSANYYNYEDNADIMDPDVDNYFYCKDISFEKDNQDEPNSPRKGEDEGNLSPRNNTLAKDKILSGARDLFQKLKTISTTQISPIINEVSSQRPIELHDMDKKGDKETLQVES